MSIEVHPKMNGKKNSDLYSTIWILCPRGATPLAFELLPGTLGDAVGFAYISPLTISSSNINSPSGILPGSLHRDVKSSFCSFILGLVQVIWTNQQQKILTPTKLSPSPFCADIVDDLPFWPCSSRGKFPLGGGHLFWKVLRVSPPPACWVPTVLIAVPAEGEAALTRPSCPFPLAWSVPRIRG